MCLPVEELLREAVLHVAGGGLLLDPTLQQHLLVHLLLLLLLFQVLLHAQPLPVELLVLLRGVVELSWKPSNEILSEMDASVLSAGMAATELGAEGTSSLLLLG